MANGQVDIRYSKRTNKYRLRFHAVAHDQLEMILLALKEGREDANTMYDCVALDRICMFYIESKNGKPKNLSQ